MPRTDSSPLGEGRVGALVLALSGLAYLAYKADYLGLDAPDALKVFIVSPSATLLVLAALAAYPDARRRLGGTFLALGVVALLWLAREPVPDGGWTFYPPLSLNVGRPPWLKGPEPILAAFATGLPFLGATILGRRSPLGGILLAASIWCALCLASSRWSTDAGMPRRYAYYYTAEHKAMPPTEWDNSDAVLPILLGLAGLVLMSRSKESGRGGTASPTASHDGRA